MVAPPPLKWNNQLETPLPGMSIPCKYRYHTIISGKNIKEKKLVSKISFLGYLKILDLCEKKKTAVKISD